MQVLQGIMCIVWGVVWVASWTDAFRQPRYRAPRYAFTNSLAFQVRLRVLSPSALKWLKKDVAVVDGVHHITCIVPQLTSMSSNSDVGESISIQVQELIRLIRCPSRSIAERVDALKILTTRRFQSIRNRSVADSIVQSFEGIVEQLEINSFPDVIRSLGILKCSISESLHQRLIDRLLRRTIDSLSLVSPNNQARLLVGFGALGTHFTSSLSTATLHNLHMLIDSVLLQHRQLTKHFLFYLSYGLYLLRARYEFLSPLTQTELVTMIQTVAQHAQQQSSKEREELLTSNNFPIAENEGLFLYHLSSLGVHKRHFYNNNIASAFLQVANSVFRTVMEQPVMI